MTFSTDSFRLDGKVAIVTGAGGRGNNIGRAYAMGLAAAGADIADPDQVAAMVATGIKAFGGIDILVNNAALMLEVAAAQAETIALEQWNRMFAVNLTGALICAQAVIPAMRARGGGRIVNQVSGGAFPAVSLYGVSKLALAGLTTTLAKQLGKDGINVNAIAPGNVTSDAGAALVPAGSAFAQFLAAQVCTRAQGAPDELLGALLLLCSEAGAWITGQTIHVDGGWVLRP